MPIICPRTSSGLSPSAIFLAIQSSKPSSVGSVLMWTLLDAMPVQEVAKQFNRSIYSLAYFHVTIREYSDALTAQRQILQVWQRATLLAAPGIDPRLVSRRKARR